MKNILSILLVAISLSASAQLPNGSIAPDFTLTDLNGNTHNLYTYLDQGKVVYLEFFACHCPSCWAFHNTNKMKDLYNTYGPDGTNQIMVLMLEHDEYNGDAFHGLGGYTQGDWITGNPVPMIDVEWPNRGVFDDYNLQWYPLIYKICPDKTTELIYTSTSVAEMYQKADDCPGTLSIEENEQTYSAYIDPFSESLKLQGFEQIDDVRIVNSIGQSMKFELIANQIDVSKFASGIYFLAVDHKSGTFVQKIYK